jgi:uncharacterized protein with HEPN domain
MNKRDKILLSKILEEASDISEFIRGQDQESFLASKVTQKAVVMSLISIGERIKNLSDELKTSYRYIPWKDIAGVRDIAAHHYSVLRMSDIWIDASEDIPVLQEQIREILNSAENT